MAHSKVLTRLLLVALAISLLCQYSVARAPASGARRRALQDGPDEENEMNDDADSPGQSQDEDEDGSQEAMEEAEEAESQKYSDPEDTADPIDDTEVAVDEPPPQFEDVPPEAFPPAASNSEDQNMQQPQPDAPAANGKDSGPSGLVVAFLVLAAMAVIAVVSAGAFFVVKRRREMKDLEFKPLRETELSNDNNGDKNDPTEQDEPTRKLQRSDSEA